MSLKSKITNKKIITHNDFPYVKYIYHISDIHIRSYDRYHEYKYVFKNLIYKIKKSQKLHKSILVITGDILHTCKNITFNLIKLVKYLFESLSKFITVIVIPGNHDYYQNTDYLKNLIPINDNIIYINKTGIYNFKNINFFYFNSLNDLKNADHNELITNSKDYINIALYHGIVSNIFNEINPDKIADLKYFKKYDYTLLGDVHKCMHLKENKIIYAGSLIQQNFGEDDNHGYVKWNIKQDRIKFKKIKNYVSYKQFNFADIAKNHFSEAENVKNNIIFTKITNLRINYMAKDIMSIINLKIAQISKLTKINECQLNLLDNKETNVSMSNTNINNFIKSGESIKNKYIAISKYPQYSNEIKDLHENLIKKLDINIDNINTNTLIDKWDIVSLEFVNLFSYGKVNNGINKLNFDSKNNIYTIIGKNSIGKSSILDIILFSIYEKCTRGKNTADIITAGENTYNTMVTLIDKNNNIEYKIYRYGSIDKKGKLTQNVKFVSENKSKNKIINLSDKNRTATNKIINGYFGTCDDLVKSNFILYNEQFNFIDATNLKKIDILIYNFNLIFLNKIIDYIDTCKNHISSKINNFPYFVENKYDMELMKNKEINKLINKLTEKKELISEKMETYISSNVINYINKLESTINKLNKKLCDNDLSDYTKKIEKKEFESDDNIKYNKYFDKYQKINQKICELEKLKENCEEIKDLKNKYSILEEYNMLLSKKINKKNNSVIIDILNNDIIKNLVIEWNIILNRIVDFQIEIDNELNLIIIKNSLKYNISTICGFEKNICNITFRIAIYNLSKCSKATFFCLDEITSILDTDQKEKLNKLKNILKESFTNIIILSPTNDILDLSDINIKILKSSNNSFIK